MGSLGIVRYHSVPLGRHTLDKMLREIFISANLNPDSKSNHSLRATSISRMYHAKVPEKQIMERSGHLSKEGVRAYIYRTNTINLQNSCCTTS